MSTADDRLALVQQNYQAALDDEPHDLAAAETAAQVAAIQANLAAAKQIYYEALEAQLTQAGGDVEQAYLDASTALDAVAQIRGQAAAMPDLISRLNKATQAASRLVAQAKQASAARG
ncbi:hypothetical protein [Chromobacterium alticapitis]|uniref:Uncharacterized protein n=1 Tax=Chromobacterium alticapitis TaxID=2073169 RepID=A0A2S5DD69_9NEIS|nr:hypothetical protein [Chromobacterium alticapitis]POZ61045.1 hypothetical protein C2I19_15675 [Chromobacterium alticapitis]